MKLLVTGGCGFIGANFIHYWTQNHPSDKIINYDNLTYAANFENVRNIPHHQHQFIRGDICDREKLDAYMSQVDICVHFAAESHVDNSIEDSSPFIQTNIVGTHTLLESALKYKVRFHHISTDEVFGSLGLIEDPFTEETPYDPKSPYSASKASSDHLVRAYHHTHGLRATISNCSNNYGRFQHKEKLIPKIILNALNDQEIPVYGQGLNVRDWIYVDDHCRAIDMIVHDGIVGETYCVGGGCEFTNILLVRKILEMLDKPVDLIKFVEDRPGHDLRYAVSYNKMSKDIGWTPKFTFETAIKETIKHYEKN